MEVLHENQDLQALDFKEVDCLPAVKNEVTRSPNFGSGGFQEDGGVKDENREIWVGQGDVSNGDVDGDPSLFYAADYFPPLPEFPCMSSSSSTSSTPAPSSATTAPAAGFSSSGATSVCSTSSSSSSSAASWAMLKSDAEVEDDYRHHHHQNNQQQLDQEVYDDRIDGVDCMNVMEDFDCMGINQLIEDSNEIWDPSPLFESDPSQIPQTQPNPFELQFQQQGHHLREFSQLHEDHPFMFLDPPAAGGDNNTEAENRESASALSEDLAVVFFEWLKSNKESISAEELRSIKIKKSTIESAARRLGGGKEAMKQLLKLILQWVQNHRLQNKPSQGESAFDLTQPLTIPPPPPLPRLLTNPIQQEPLPCYNPLLQQPSPWISPYVTDPGGVAIAPAPSSFTSYIGGGHDPYGVLHQPYHVPPPPPDQYHVLDGSMTPWTGQLGAAPPQFLPGPIHYNTGPDGSALLHSMAPQGYPGYGNGYNPYQMFPGPGDGLLRTGSSATKEARKKRMARQRRVFTHHHHRNSHHNPNQQHQGNGGHQQQQQQQMIQGGCVDHDSSGSVAHGCWMYWPPTAGGPMMGSIQPHQQPAVSERTAVMAQGSQRQAASDKKQGFKTEKNLKFLLQKVLKQSDVGNLGRIVLPKKEAETHLPELEARDGIPIAMEDIGTSRVWNMRYRFWPNNKSRMYLLENTGDFVRSNGLQEGDFIVIYSDVKCGKYMIRGVKVRPQQQQGSKPELAQKPPSKAHKTQNSSSPASSALSPLTHRQ